MNDKISLEINLVDFDRHLPIIHMLYRIVVAFFNARALGHVLLCVLVMNFELFCEAVINKRSCDTGSPTRMTFSVEVTKYSVILVGY